MSEPAPADIEKALLRGAAAADAWVGEVSAPDDNDDEEEEEEEEEEDKDVG